MTSNLQRLLANATPGPWRVDDLGDEHFDATNHRYCVGAKSKPTYRVAMVEGMGPESKAHAALIALAVNHVEELVRALENARRSILCPSDDRAANASAVESGYLLAKIEAAAKEAP